MTESTDELLRLTAVTATCTDCGGKRIFVPVDDVAATGEFCCTACDAAIFLLVSPALPATRRARSRRARSRVA